MINLAGRLKAVIQAAGVAITDVSIGDDAIRSTWKVRPLELQSAAQPTIDAFDVNDPAHDSAELDVTVKGHLDQERIFSAIIWVILKQMYPTDTDAQTKTKFGVARTRVIDSFKAQPWKA